MIENQKTCRPREHLHAMAKKYPGAWKQIDMMRAKRGSGLPDWPDWCFCPTAGSANVICVNPPTLSEALDICSMTALSAWRVGQGVYKFDPSLYYALLNTPITGDLPSDILYRLPEWCVYIETPGMKDLFGSQLYGFFAHLDFNTTTRCHDLCLIQDSEQSLIMFGLHIGPWPLKDAVINAFKNAKMLPSVSEYQINRLTTFLEPLLSLLLYLCSENAELGNTTARPTRPISKRTKKSGIRLVAPNKQRNWDVGVRIGAALRRHQQFEQNNHTKDTHSNLRPHLRRAHWHTYKTGVGRSESILKWLSPIPVNIDDIDALPSTVRKVA